MHTRHDSSVSRFREALGAGRAWRAPPCAAGETESQSVEMTRPHLLRPNPCIFHRFHVGVHPVPAAPTEASVLSLPSICCLTLSAKRLSPVPPWEGTQDGGVADEHGLTDGMSSRWQARWPWFHYSGDTVDYRGREPGGQESGLTTAVIRAGEAGVTLKGKGKSSDLSGETNDSS